MKIISKLFIFQLFLTLARSNQDQETLHRVKRSVENHKYIKDDLLNGFSGGLVLTKIPHSDSASRFKREIRSNVSDDNHTVKYKRLAHSVQVYSDVRFR